MPRSIIFLALFACGSNGDPECDTGPFDTADDCFGGGGGGQHTNPTTQPNSAPVAATLVASNGETIQFASSSVVGEYDATRFGFNAMGADVTNNLTVGVATGSGLGSYTLTDGQGDSPATYTDFRWGIQNGGFVSTGGTVTITGWEPTTAALGSGAKVSGTLSVHLTNSPDPTDPAPVPITLDLTADITEIFLLDAG